MGDTPDRKTTLKPITGDDVARTALFLHSHMNSKFSAQEWERGLRASWYENAPNHGFMLEFDGEVVGVVCALYSEQEIDGEPRLICNPHTCCVLEPYRAKSVSLILSVIRQPDMHYSMYSPNRDGEEIFAYLGFKPMGREALAILNLPTPQLPGKVEVSFELNSALDRLSVADRKCVQDHRDFPWLRFIFYASGSKHGFLIYKPCRYKRLPCAELLYVSDKSLFARCWPAIRTRLLLRQGVFTTKAELRLLQQRPGFSFSTAHASAKFFLSDSLPAEAFNYTYSELVALNL